MQRSDIITFRSSQPTDEAFIYHSWISGYRYGSKLFEKLEPAKEKQFYSRYHRAIESILARPTTTVKIACLIDDPSTILGFSVTETKTLTRLIHWVFVKPPWRDIGLGKDLIPVSEHVNVATHLTKPAEAIIRKWGMPYLRAEEFDDFNLKEFTSNENMETQPSPKEPDQDERRAESNDPGRDSTGI